MNHFVFGFCKKAFLTLTFLLVVFRCADDQFLAESTALIASTDLNTTTTTSTGTMDCSGCDYVVPGGNAVVDGIVLGLKPGSIIGLSANVLYTNIAFRNLEGTPDQPIIIKNCGGTARIDGTGTGFSIKTSYSKYFRLTGGSDDQSYGIIITGGHIGLSLGGLSTDFEVDHLEIANSGFAGIMAKTDPNCDDATIRENFLMEDVSIHHNYIHDTGGEGIYAGNSWFMGMNTACGVRLPHEIHNIEIFKNILKNTGWEAIQLGCATEGASIHDNQIENYGVVNKKSQNNGIQISSGTGGLCYNNLIKKGTGSGLIVFGLGDNIIYNNIIDEAGTFGIFCDERESPGPGFQFLNNTIINSVSDGIRIYAELVPMNVIVNNIIANPGSYSTYTYPRSPEDAFVYTLNDDVKIEMANNYFTTDTDSLKIVNATQSNYVMDSSSPVVDKGGDISKYHNILTDFLGHARLAGAGYDIGAIEAFDGTAPPPANIFPVANAGVDITITLPDNSVYIEGTASDSDGSIVSYQWTQVSGETSTLEGTTTPRLYASNLKAGTYSFRLAVTDDAGDAQYDDVEVNVLIGDNHAPVANAGPNQIFALPRNSTKLYGTATDSDGTVESYLWTQYGGPPAVISNAESATATVSGMVEGKYYFRLTVQDNAGATHFDNMLIKVEPNVAPVANAGPNKILTLPENSITLFGTGTDEDGKVVEYTWTQYGGPTAVITNAHTATPTISGLTAGKYYFRLTVKDDDDATHFDNMLLKVEEPLAEPEASAVEVNAAPQANAGPNLILTLPENSTQLHGTATDSDGSIESFQWIQYSGPEAVLSEANQATATVSSLTEGKYYFRLTAEDNEGATHYDNMLLKVLPDDEI